MEPTKVRAGRAVVWHALAIEAWQPHRRVRCRSLWLDAHGAWHGADTSACSVWPLARSIAQCSPRRSARRRAHVAEEVSGAARTEADQPDDRRWGCPRAAGRQLQMWVGRRRPSEQRWSRGQGLQSWPHIIRSNERQRPGWTVFHLPSTPDGISSTVLPGRSLHASASLCSPPLQLGTHGVGAAAGGG